MTNHASKTRCRNTCETLGAIPPPCGAPLSGERRAPASRTPAWSHGPSRLPLPLSLTLGGIHSRRGPQARVSQHPLTSAATLQARCDFRYVARSSCSAWCGLCPLLTPWDNPGKAGSTMASTILPTARWPILSSKPGGPSGRFFPSSFSLHTRAPGGATYRLSRNRAGRSRRLASRCAAYGVAVPCSPPGALLLRV